MSDGSPCGNHGTGDSQFRKMIRKWQQEQLHIRNQQQEQQLHIRNQQQEQQLQEQQLHIRNQQQELCLLYTSPSPRDRG